MSTEMNLLSCLTLVNGSLKQAAPSDYKQAYPS